MRFGRLLRHDATVRLLGHLLRVGRRRRFELLFVGDALLVFLLLRQKKSARSETTRHHHRRAASVCLSLRECTCSCSLANCFIARSCVVRRFANAAA